MGNNVLALTFPAGKALYTTRQTKAMTVGADTVSLTVPAGKRWVVGWGYITNDSGAAINVTISVTDGTNEIGLLFSYSNMPTTGKVGFPRTDTDEAAHRVADGAYPIMLEAGQVLLLSWSADAGKSGNSYWYIHIREL